MNILNEFHILLHVIIAAVLSGIVGFEREKSHKPAGIKTNMMVGGAVALLVLLGEIIVFKYSNAGLTNFIQTDPTRIIQAIIVGVSFIGAGTVLQNKREQEIRYLTTAATFLFSTGIGIAVALQQYILAGGVTIFTVIINIFIGWVNQKIRNK
ncbi:MAG: MgtC/SapB family protein [Bacteroidota bacterium]